MKRVSVRDGTVTTVCKMPETAEEAWTFGGAAWGPDGDYIVFSTRKQIWEVPAQGGNPRVLIESEGSKGSATWNCTPSVVSG